MVGVGDEHLVWLSQESEIKAVDKTGKEMGRGHHKSSCLKLTAAAEDPSVTEVLPSG